MASERTVSEWTLSKYNRKADVWVFASVPFIRQDGEGVNAGYAQLNQQATITQPVAKFTGSLSSGNLVIAAGVLPVTENSQDHPTATLVAWLVDPARSVVIDEFAVFGKGFRVPDGTGDLTWLEIEANMIGGLAPSIAHDVLVNGNFHTTGNGLFDGSLTVGSGLFVTGNSTLTGILDILDGGLTVDGPLTASADSEFQGDLQVLGDFEAGNYLGITSAMLPTVLAGKTLNNTQLTGSLTGLLSSMLPTVLQNKTLQNPTFSGTTSFSQNLNIAGTVTAAHLAGEGSAITGVISAGIGGTSSPGALGFVADSDNSGGTDRRMDFIMGQGGSAATRFSIVENKFGFNTPVSDALMSVAFPYPDTHTFLPMRFKTYQAQRADFALHHSIDN